MESTQRAAAGRADTEPDPSLERIQREHELNRALEAARTLQERLELAGMRDNAVTVHRIRDDLAARLAALADASDYGVPQLREQVLLIAGGPPCQASSELPID